MSHNPGKFLHYHSPPYSFMSTVFTHFMIGARDIQEAETFYDGVFGILGLQKKAGATGSGGRRLCYSNEDSVTQFYITEPINGKPGTAGNGGTIGLGCASPEQVKAIHDKAVELGGKSVEDPPGYRSSGAYLAYFLDPTGNKYCATTWRPETWTK